MLSNKLFRLITVGIALCLLVTFATVHLTNTFVGHDITVRDAGYDGHVTEGTAPTGEFVRTVTQNKSILEAIKQFEYRFFGIVDQENIIAGKNDFLFMLEDTENRYHFLRDHRGQFTFSFSQKQRFVDELLRRRDYFAERDASYMLVVLPTTMSLYREYLPDYVGQSRGTTRLDDLESYIATRGMENMFLNTTDYLIEQKDKGLLANNTGNSLTALGLYFAYRAVCEQINLPTFDKSSIISEDTLSFYTYQSAGKEIAEAAGLEGIVKNNSVSLAEGMLTNYETVYAEGFFKKTSRNVSTEQESGFSALIQFSKLSDRLQSEPYFSCTFDYATLQSNHYQNESFFEVASPQLVIQFVYENELSSLISLR